MTVLFLLLAVGVFASEAPSVSVDGRVELLGVLQRLAGVSRPGVDAPGLAEDVDRHFEKFRDHEAVKDYARIAADPAAERSLLTLLFYLEEPPALGWRGGLPPRPKEREADLGGRAAVEALVARWRDFARKSRFADHLAGRRERHERWRKAVEASLAAGAHLEKIEAYVGPLDSRVRIALSPLLRARRFATIIPYPFQGAGTPVKGPFEVVVVAEPDAVADGEPVFSPSGFWSEALDVAVDPLLSEHCEELEALRGLGTGSGCPPEWFNCATNLMKDALLDRLAALHGAGAGFPVVRWPKDRYGRYGPAFTAALRDYEERRSAYPDLRAFYPRLVAVFQGLAREHGAARLGPSGLCADRRDRGPVAAPSPDPGPPRTAEAWRRRGVWSFSRGRLSDAAADLLKARGLEPADPETRLNLSVVLAAQGRRAEALAEAEEAVRLSSGAPQALQAAILSNRDSLRKTAPEAR